MAADTNKNDGVKINEYHRDVDALDGMTYLCLLCPLYKNNNKQQKQHQKYGVEKVEPKSFHMVMGKGGIYQKWFERG